MNSFLRRSRRRILLIISGILLLGIGIFLIYNAVFFEALDNISFSRTYTDRNGELLNIYLTHDEKYRIRTPLLQFPQKLVQAVLLQEDRYFYSHNGINPVAMFRAGWETYIKRSRRMGASTITMQLARLKFNLYTRNISGKMIQTLGALFLEICLSKEEILEAYLNLAPCGGNIEGYAAAAWYYFNKDVRDLTISEILSLVVIPQNPSKRAPLKDHIPEEFLEGRQQLFNNWVYESPEDELFRTEMDFAPLLLSAFPQKAPHHTEFLNSQYSGFLFKTATTIDLAYQTLCERQLASYIARNNSWGVKNGSIFLLDYTTMEVLAAVGSADFFNEDIQGQVNGTNSKRSPASTLKPFIYALAIEQGIIHPEIMLKDTPQGFNEYTPDNYQSQFKGPIKAWDALVDSRNIPAIHLAMNIKTPGLYDFLKDAGISGLKEKDHYGLSIVLGSADLTMMELVELYSALPNQGIKKPLRFFNEEPEYNHTNQQIPDETSTSKKGTRILSPEAAWITLRMLERNPVPESVYHQGKRIPVAYKTGTSIGFKDAWSVAVFDRYVLAVWLGNFSGEGNNVFLGRLMATPLLFHIIDAMENNFGTAPFVPTPNGVSEVEVCSVSGNLPGEYCPELINTWFIPGVSPITKCNIHRKVYINTQTGYRTDETEGPFIRSEIREFWPTDLLEIFKAAGLPRFTPPPYPPEEDSLFRNYRGFPPVIISPLSYTTYIIREEDEKYRELVLMAGADQDAGELFWFANTAFLGKALSHEKLLWKPGPGTYNLSVIDSRGRSVSTKIVINFAE